MIFDWLIGISSLASKVEITYIPVSDDGLDTDIIQARREREANSRASLSKLISRINSLSEFQRWMYFEHNCYNCNFKNSETINESVKASY